MDTAEVELLPLWMEFLAWAVVFRMISAPAAPQPIDRHSVMPCLQSFQKVGVPNKCTASSAVNGQGSWLESKSIDSLMSGMATIRDKMGHLAVGPPSPRR